VIIQHLIVETRGAFVGKHSERLMVTANDETIVQAPLMHLESVLIATNAAGVSAEAVRECAERGIPIHFLDGRGKPFASMYSSGLTATIATRRAQILAYLDDRGLRASFAFARGKILNQSNLLKYAAKYRKETAPDTYTELQRLAADTLAHDLELDDLMQRPELTSGQRASIDEWRFELLSIEGRAAKAYWSGVKVILNVDLGWPGREGRGASDPFNSALNFGYGVLYGQVERAIVLAGLDPFAGFTHVDRPGKPSLTLDLIEEFRQSVVDRTVIGLVNKGFKIEQEADGRIAPASRRVLAERVLARLDGTESFDGRRLALSSIIQTQARRLAEFLRGDVPNYVAFVGGW
jgi:CRISPR-associated protein Cas1